MRLATDQNVPTNGVGGMAQWSKAFGRSNAFSAGFDMRWVDGESQEAAYVAAVPTSIVGVTQAATLSVQRYSGGTQKSLGEPVRRRLVLAAVCSKALSPTAPRIAFE